MERERVLVAYHLDHDNYIPMLLQLATETISPACIVSTVLSYYPPTP